MAVMLSNSPQRRTAGGMREEKEQKGAEDDEGEGIMFSHQRGAGGWAEGMCLCTSIYVNGFVSPSHPPPHSHTHTHRRNGHVTLTLAWMLPLSSEDQPTSLNGLFSASCIA